MANGWSLGPYVGQSKGRATTHDFHWNGKAMRSCAQLMRNEKNPCRACGWGGEKEVIGVSDVNGAAERVSRGLHHGF